MDLLIYFSLRLIAGILVVVSHEVPKSITAYFVTHPIYRQTMKPNTKMYKYIDPIGLLMFAFMRVGWQKPFHYRASRFIDKDKGPILVALTGIFSNILLITILIPVYKYVGNEYVKVLLIDLIIGSISITVINMLPIPPFDMSAIMKYLAPDFYLGIMRNERILHVVFIMFIATGFCLTVVRGLMNIVFPLIL